MNQIRTASSWVRLSVGLVTVFGMFHWFATALSSGRGEAGVAVGALVIGATFAIERIAFGTPLSDASRALGLGRPRATGVLAAVAVSVSLLPAVPLFAWIAGTSVEYDPQAPWLLPGLFAQAGIAEELLFRGYLFAHLRRQRTFWHAALLSMIPFVAVHLWLFTTMAWPIASAAVLLAVVMSFPLAQLFELGGATIWAPAVLHFVVQSVPKLVVFHGDAPAPFALVWMATAAVLPCVVFLIPRPDAGARPR